MKYWTKEWYRHPEETKPVPDGDEYEKVVNLLPPFYAEDFAMFGAVLTGCEMPDGKIILNFNSDDAYTAINRVIFSGTEMITQETPLIPGLIWKYDEIYRENDRFVLHILFADPAEELYYVTLAFTSIEVGYDDKKRREDDRLLGILGMFPENPEQ